MAQNEIFPLVDENGNVIGQATREECHSGSKLLHPVIHLHIFDSQGRIYLQKRSMNKDIQPGKWDTAVGGHVDYGEDIESAMLRESKEELGIKDFSYEKLFSYVFESNIEKELVNTFIAKNFAQDIKVDKEEIEEGKFWELKEVEESLGKNIFTPNFENEFQLIKKYI